MSRGFPRSRVALGMLGGVALGFFAWGMPARADGPRIAYHATRGKMAVTVFSAPDPLVAGPVDLNVLVQRADDGGMVTARVSGRLVRGRTAIPFGFAAGEGGRLPEADVQLPVAGDYQMELAVQTAGGLQRFDGVLQVAENHGQRNTVLLAVFLPVVLVLLFLTNQQAKRQLRRSRGVA